MRWWSGEYKPTGGYARVNIPTEEVRAEGCGTCACIAGWASALLGPVTDELEDNEMIEVGSKLLGLEDRTARELFIPWINSNLDHSWFQNINDIPPKAGAMVLDHLLETGKVDWSIIGPRRCYDEAGKEITGEQEER